MGEIFTGEIDLRPSWAKFLAEKKAAFLNKKSKKPSESDLNAPAGMSKVKNAGVSVITAFDARVGNPSRNVIYVAVAIGVLIVGLLFFSGGEPPTSEAPQVAPAIGNAEEKPNVELVGSSHSYVEKTDLFTEKTKKAEHSAKKSAASSDFGKLKLRSEPSVVVYDGERRLGRTPLQVKLPVGKHKLTLSARHLHLKSHRTFNIRPDRTTERQVYFGIGKLQLTAPDGAKVYLGSRFVGRAPLKTLKVAEGNYRLKVVHEGNTHKERIEIAPSATVRYRVRF